MKIGFTGTREGMTDLQKDTVKKLLTGLKGDVSGFHHGDCLGADAEAHEIAENLSYYIIIHPPINKTMRAYCEGYWVTEERHYLDRNKDIVKETDTLIATPNTFEEKERSGTWSTVRFARKQNKFIFIVWPDGSVKIG